MFIISTYLSRLKETARLKEFTNKHHIDLAKFFFNDDIKGIGGFFEEALYDLLINKDIFSKLTCIEKFALWLELYYNCISDYILYNNVEIEIKSFTNKILAEDFICSKDIILDNIKITLNAPALLYLDGIDDMVDSIIYSITSDEDIFYFSSFTVKEKEQFLSSLPSNIFNDIIKYHEIISSKTINISPQSNHIKIDPLIISPCNNSIFEFLKSIFASDLYNHHSNALIFMKQINGSYESYINMTPRDFLSLYKIYEKSIKNPES